jgi:hypothetical protein
MNGQEDIDIDLLIQLMQEENDWMIKEWQREVMEQFETNRYDRKEKPA